MADFEFKRGDRLPALRVTLKDTDGDAVPVTGATVKFQAMTEDGTTVIDATAVLTDAANGIVTYNWTAADVATARVLLGEFHVTFASGLVQSFPYRGYLEIVIYSGVSDA